MWRPHQEGVVGSLLADYDSFWIMMKHRFLILVILLFAALSAFGAAEPLSCADKSIVASAVRTPQDVQTFVQCAYEFVQEVGFEEARRAFHEDERWRSGPIYLFVSEATPMADQALRFVFPPRPSTEGLPRGLVIDVFGNEYYRGLNRIVSSYGEGWVHYSFTNPATGRNEPKISYVKSIDWDGTPAAIGAGVYRRDIPGTCWREEVNAMDLEDDPSPERLQEFVRCAALELEAKGYFATLTLSTDPRWRSNSIYLFGLDRHGNTLFSGESYNGWFGSSVSELNPDLNETLEGQDLVSVAEAFGESFLYYSTRNPATGMLQRKVTFVKRVVASGVPVLVGSGYYPEDEE